MIKQIVINSLLLYVFICHFNSWRWINWILLENVMFIRIGKIKFSWYHNIKHSWKEYEFTVKRNRKEITPLSKKLFAISYLKVKGKSHFLQWSVPSCINHTPRQTTCSGIFVQHKMNSIFFVDVLFYFYLGMFWSFCCCCYRCSCKFCFCFFSVCLWWIVLIWFWERKNKWKNLKFCGQGGGNIF